MGEDDSHSRKANLLANMALLRSVLLALLADHCPDQSLTQITEQLNLRPSRSLDLLCS